MSIDHSSDPLFQPLNVGAITLSHRVALAPLTRNRATDDLVPTDMMIEYYSQRASVPGTLLITEGTLITLRTSGFNNVPGVWSDAQIAAWKKVVDAVHAKGSYIYCQLWALGRAANTKDLHLNLPGAEIVSSGNIAQEDRDTPRPLTHEEIDQYVEDYAQAARNAVFGAGFDGVELHGANGYLIDQFIKSTINNRTDEYGGSIENRLRFPLRAIDAVVAAVGATRTAIRLSPYERFAGAFMPDPIPTYSALVSELARRDLAYIHFTEARVASSSTTDYTPSAPGTLEHPEGETLDFARKIWAPRPIILAGAFTPALARQRAAEGEAKGENIIIAFGRYFISNPDLPYRIRNNIALTHYDRPTFYLAKQAKGYIDYPFAQS